LTAATLGQELSSALKQVHGWIEQPEMDEDPNIRDQKKLLAFGQRIKQALRDVWKDPATDVFNIGYCSKGIYQSLVLTIEVLIRSQEEVLRIDALAEEIATIQNLRNSFNPILSVILMALDSPAIFVRTKALKALGVIVTSDSTILSAVGINLRSITETTHLHVISQLFVEVLRVIFSITRLPCAMQL
jgi:cohesin loading factor subunit SCC2